MNRLEEISRNLDVVRAKIAAVASHPVTLIAVTKTFPASDLQILQQLGVKDLAKTEMQKAQKSRRWCRATGTFKVRSKAIS